MGGHLKTNMVLPGIDYKGSDADRVRSPEFVAKATIDLFLETVPPEVPSINFLSGGLSDQVAAIYLNEMNKYIASNNLLDKFPEHKWLRSISFSFGRALQQPVFDAFKPRMLFVHKDAEPEDPMKHAEQKANEEFFWTDRGLFAKAQEGFRAQGQACSDAAQGKLDVPKYQASFAKA